MAGLYHFTQWENKESIIKEGLRIDVERSEFDIIINDIFDRFRPGDLPKHISRCKCIFFNMFQWPIYEGKFGIVVDSDSLDVSKLYVLNYTLAHQIYKSIEELILWKQEINVQAFEDMIKEYWKSMIRYSDYIKNHGENEDVEVLYFTSVPIGLIRFINDQSPLIDKALSLLSTNKYEFTNERYNYISVRKGTGLIAEMSIRGAESEHTFAIEYNSDIDKELLSYITDVLGKEFVIMVEEKKNIHTSFRELIFQAQELFPNYCDKKED